MVNTWELELADVKSIFPAAHFVVGNRYCEPLHGHDYNIRVIAIGEMGRGQMVIDFLDLKPILRKVTSKLKGKILLPKNNNLIVFKEKNDDNSLIVKIPSKNKKYIFPQTDIILLPVKNTTVEELSRYIGIKVLEEIKKLNVSNVRTIKVWVGETKNQGCWYILPLEGNF